MNFIFEWWKQYFTNERSEWVKYCFHHEKIKFISSNRRVMFFLLYSCKQYKNPVSNIHFWSIMQKISFISTNYIILFELEEYLCIILVFSCSIFIFSGNNMLFFSFNIGSRLLQRSLFWKQNYWREMITWSISSLVKIWKISHCVFSVSYCQLYNKIWYFKYFNWNTYYIVKGTRTPFERCDFTRCRDNNDNNVIWYYLSRLETKIKVILKDLTKFKIHCKFDRPLLHDEPQWAA